MSFLDKITSGIQDVDTDQLASQVTKSITEHQNTLFKLVLIVGTLTIGVMIFNDHHAKEAGIRARISQAQEKLEAIKDRDAAIQGLGNFKSSIPKTINVFELIPLISNYAKQYNSNISSYSPDQSKNMGLYDVLNVHFDMVSDNFKDMMLFLRRIEKSNYPLRIDSWSGNKAEDGKISFTIEISAVLIHP
jgi:hypothetical protein